MPIYELRNDGRDNLLGALLIAGQYVIPEVRKWRWHVVANHLYDVRLLAKFKLAATKKEVRNCCICECESETK